MLEVPNGRKRNRQRIPRMELCDLCWPGESAGAELGLRPCNPPPHLAPPLLLPGGPSFLSSVTLSFAHFRNSLQVSIKFKVKKKPYNRICKWQKYKCYHQIGEASIHLKTQLPLLVLHGFTDGPCPGPPGRPSGRTALSWGLVSSSYLQSQGHISTFCQLLSPQPQDENHRHLPGGW